MWPTSHVTHYAFPLRLSLISTGLQPNNNNIFHFHVDTRGSSYDASSGVWPLGRKRCEGN